MQDLESRKKAVLNWLNSNWLKDPLNIFLILVLVFAFLIRLKYFAMNNALWWDEATYLNSAKYWAFGDPFWKYEVSRPPLFMLLLAISFKLGLNEVATRFISVMLPSLGVVIFTYLLGKEFYSKQVGIIAAFMMSVFWVDLTNVTRVHTDPLATLLALSSIYCFWKGYVIQKEEKKTWLVVLSGILLSLAFLTRVAIAMIAIVFFIFLLLTDKFNFLKQKSTWLTAIFAIIPIIPYSIWSYMTYKKPLIAAQVYAGTSQATIEAGKSLDWRAVTNIFQYSLPAYFIAFLIGLATLYTLIIGIDLIIKDRDRKSMADLFNVIQILVVIMFFMVIYREIGDMRWMFMMAPPIFFIAGKGLMLIYNYIQKFNKYIAVAIIIAVLLFGGYQHYKIADPFNKSRQDSQIQLKLAGLWLKDHTSKDDRIITTSEHAQLTYYSNRKIDGFEQWEKDYINSRINEVNPKYVLLAFFWPNFPWENIINYIAENKQRFKAVEAYGPYVNKEQTIPLLTIIEVSQQEAQQDTKKDT